jgi:hypothetical protein
MSELGLNSALGQCPLNVRITPESDRIADIRGRRKSAKLRKAQNEQMFSALPPITDIASTPVLQYGLKFGSRLTCLFTGAADGTSEGSTRESRLRLDVVFFSGFE